MTASPRIEQIAVMDALAKAVPAGRIQFVGEGFRAVPLPCPEHQYDTRVLARELRAMDVGEVVNGAAYASGLDGELGAYVVPEVAVERGRLDLEWAREHHNYLPLSGLHLVAEVKSGALALRHPIELAPVYAACGIEVFVVIGRAERRVLVHSGPDRGKAVYRRLEEFSFGEPVVLPAPFGTLATSGLV